MYNGMLKAKLTGIEILTKLPHYYWAGHRKKIHQMWSSISQTEESEKQLCRAGIGSLETLYHHQIVKNPQ